MGQLTETQTFLFPPSLVGEVCPQVRILECLVQLQGLTTQSFPRRDYLRMLLGTDKDFC